jgi:peptide/nickel transport system substrate-binding protein
MLPELNSLHLEESMRKPRFTFSTHPITQNGCQRLFAAATLALLVSIIAVPTPSLAHIRTLNVVAPWELKSPDPAKSGYMYLRMEVIETLTSVDHDGKIEPCLATRWTVSPDGIKWRFTIRDGVKFHDGTLMKPETVVKSLQFALKKPGMMKKAPIREITWEGSEVVFVLERPYAILDSVLSHYSTAILAPSAYTEDGEVKELIATGPYKALYIKPPQELQARYFREYWGEKPNIQSTHYLAVSRNETRALMAQSGDADIIFTLDPVTLKRLQKFKRISTFVTSLPRTVVIKPNCALQGLHTAQLRKALSNGIDRKGIGLAVMRREESAAYQLFPESLGHWHVPSLDKPDGSKQAYKQLMVQEGWQENEQGYLEKDGKILEMTIITYSDRPELPVAAAALQDQMRQMGIKLNVSISSSSSIPLGHNENTLEMGLIARNYGLISNPLGTVLQDYGPTGGDWGAMNWSNKELLNLLGELEQTVDPVKQKQNIKEVCILLDKEMPSVPIVAYQHSAITSNDILNFSLDPLERTYRITEMQWKEE